MTSTPGAREGAATTGVEALLRRQWRLLRGWLESERVLDHALEPSGLGRWTVGDLVVHLGFGIRMVAEVTPAPDAAPVTIAAYVRGYAPAGERIAADTAETAAAVRGAELEGIDRMADEAWRALDRGLPAVVLGRRGPLRGEDFLLTRLVELVAHGDDLHRVVGEERPSPLAPDALDRVCAVLAAAYEEVALRPPSCGGLDLLRAATGRTPTDDPALPLLS